MSDEHKTECTCAMVTLASGLRIPMLRDPNCPTCGDEARANEAEVAITNEEHHER